jgi:hypothetical protein
VVIFTSRPLQCRAKTSGTHFIEDWVVPRAGLDVVAKKKNLYHCRELNLGSLAHSLVTTLTELPWLSLNIIWVTKLKDKTRWEGNVILMAEIRKA